MSTPPNPEEAILDAALELPAHERAAYLDTLKMSDADLLGYAWRLWQYDWRAKPGDHSILSRATDTQGRVQPNEPVWNPSGYLYNAIDQVKIHVA